ncbi:restriction endonuclease subunit S [Allochromatium vinosum]|uniref:Restriction modification system DNA specificity domain protein n=1 Tax=Allochromatium vinosum (strain ATCC 17899 / DSM 180 / NBRC 103801 / NCIMB 10441 / D) TaxID=572477 RepID=D3RW62_ALLVD|nr:restriction endonuclease subunit S [Allochromatium vinosum]ADC64074.1 restriction modification system DNA specificity domain protein [Allochromatium vinosum DSM 180]
MSFSHDVEDLVADSNDRLHATADWWERVPLGDVCDILNGFPFKSQHFNNSEGAPVIRIRDVTSGFCKTFYSGDIPVGYWVEPFDMVVGMDGDFNCRLWSSERSLLNQRVCKLTPHEDFLDKKFLSYVLPAYLRLINDHTHSITVKHLSSKTIAKIPFPLPPLAEQRRIVAKLDRLFERTRRAREELSHIPRLIENYKKAILVAAFRGDLTKDWREKRGLPMPKEVKLGEVAKKLSYGTSAKSSKSGDVPVLRMGNIQNMRIDWKDLVYTSDVEEIEKYSLNAGDVLFNRTNSPELVGKTAIYKGERPAIYAGYLIKIKCGNRLVPEYLNYCLNSPLGRSYCWRVKSDGVSQSNINAKKLADFSFLLPTHDEQKEIVFRIEKTLDWLDSLVIEERQASHLLDHLDQANLAKAFRGELVPQDPSDEPASVLLEQIYADREKQVKIRKNKN